MRVTFHNKLKTCVATKDEPRAYKDLLYAALSECTEVLLEGAYYRIKGLLVRPPLESPPAIEVLVEWIRRDAAGDDYC